MTITAVRKEDIVKLREKTGAGFMECKGVLQESGGDLTRAIELLRKKGLLIARKKSGRAAREGVVQAYIHSGNRVGVLVEIACETDFVARNSDFQEFVKGVAMQIAASHPDYVSREEVPQAVVEKEKDIRKGDLEKFYQEACLLDQPFIKRPDINIQAYLTEMVAKLGENIVIRRFTRYELGEDTQPDA